MKTWAWQPSLLLFVGLSLCCIAACNEGPHTLEREPRHLAGAIEYANTGYIESSTDPRFIHFNGIQNIVGDDRTHTLIDGDVFVRCAETGTPEVLKREKLFIVVRFCDRVFVVANDFSIRSFMTLDTYIADGDEILEGIRRDLPLHICQMIRYRSGMRIDQFLKSPRIYHDATKWSVVDTQSGFEISDRSLISHGDSCAPQVQCIVEQGVVVALCNIFFVIDEDWVVQEISYHDPCPKQKPDPADLRRPKEPKPTTDDLTSSITQSEVIKDENGTED